MLKPEIKLAKEPTVTNEPIVSLDLLSKIQEYLSLLDNPDVGLTPEQAEETAGIYFDENIKGQYTDSQISTAIWMHR